MKTILWILCVVLSVTPAIARTDEARRVLDKAAKLAKDNNHREAAEVLTGLLGSPDTAPAIVAEALPLAVRSRMSLGDDGGAEQVIEDSVKAHADQWLVLAAAARALNVIGHNGHLVDGKFKRERVHYPAPEPWVSSDERDRVRSLQLLMAARSRLHAQQGEEAARGGLAADAYASLKDRLFLDLYIAWARHSSVPWKLQRRTDLTALPEPRQLGDDDDSYSRGYPVDAEGRPVYFKMPASYEAAASDGERMRFALQEYGGLGTRQKLRATLLMARQAQSWLGVQTVMADLGNRNAEEGLEQRKGIAALHTLAEDETTARLATGPARFKLPSDYAFIPRLREVAHSDATDDATLVPEAFQQLVRELRERRQLDQAAEELKLAVQQTRGSYQKSFAGQLDQIVGNNGAFDNREAQPEGTRARLPLLFNNAAKVSLTARVVNVAKLLEDTKAYLKSQPANQDWNKTNLSMLSGRLLEKGGRQYIGAKVAEWSENLVPAEHHWQKRVELETPLTKAGAYWVEAKFEGGHVTRALLWIEGLTIVRTNEATGQLFFVCDAVTGAPAPAARMDFFGYKMTWKDSGNFKKRPGYEYQFRELRRTADERGLVKAADLVQDKQPWEWQWLVTAHDDTGRLAFSGFEQYFAQPSTETEGMQPRIYIITDRPVYRPGQEVKWKFWARQAGYDPKLQTNAWQGHPCKVTISNQRNERVQEKNFTLDDSGAVEGVFKLAEGATLGAYALNVSIDDAQSGPTETRQFRVEEYKKPEFEVKVTAPDNPVALGDSFEFRVSASYYFGGPVKEGRVKYKVSRTPHTGHWFPYGRWDWLFGAGYNWHSTTYDWYPGARNWSVCMPPFPWLPWNRTAPPEVIAEGETAIGADGVVKVKIDTALARELHGDEDHRYEIEAEVTDNSRRTIFGKGQALAARRAFETYAWLDRGWYQTGDAAQASFSSRTLDGKAVTASGRLRVLKLTYDKDGTPNEEEVAAFEIKTAGDEPGMQTLKWSKPGQYRLALLLKDAAGHESQTSIFVVVRGDGFNGNGFRFDDLELLTNKEEYQPGDEVEVQVNTNRPGSTVALFVRAEKGADPVWLKPEGKSTTWRFRLGEADQPNIFLHAFTVADARLHEITRQIIVPPSKRIATVTLKADKETYLPRDKASTKLVVKDENGRPFAGQVVITAYDKALEYISGGSNMDDIRPFFWGWKREFSSHTSADLRGLELTGGPYRFPRGGMADFDADGTSPRAGAGAFAPAPMVADGAAPMRALAKAAPAAPPPPADPFAAPAIGGKAGQAAAAPPVMIRSNLADSVVWIASARTNEAGEASLDFAMPDNLTTWKLQSWVMGPDTQVGEAAVEVITRKNLMVRLQAPRFFVEKDEVVISANVHNELDKEQAVEAQLETEGSGGNLTPMDGGKPPSQRLAIPAHAEHRFDWRLKVSGAGKVVVRAKALAQEDSDAMEMSFPVYEHGTLKTESWSLGLKPDQTQGSLTFTVPEERRPEMSRLEVRYSPTLAMALVDALPYLSGYPYGCTEQTLNRFVPSVVTLGVLKDLGLDLKQVRDKRVNLNAQETGDAGKRGQRWQGKDEHGNPVDAVFDEGEVEKRALAGYVRLNAMRNADGGWGWFPGGGESSAHMTALVAHGMKTALLAGLKADADPIDVAILWLRRHETKEVLRLKLPEKDPHHKGRPDNTDALVHSVLAGAHQASSDMHQALYEHRGDLSHYSLALLGLACDDLKRTEERDMCLRNLRQFLKLDDENQTAWLDLPANGWWWYDDPIETQAAFLRLLVRAEPKSDEAPRVAKYLLNNRRHGTWWNSTRDTAAVIEALAAFMKASGEQKPDLTLEVLLDGVVKKQVKVTAETVFSFDNSLVLEGAGVSTGKHTVEFRKQGGGPLYANAYLTLYSKEDMIPAAGLEVKVERRFYKLTEQKQSTEVSGSRGQVISQQGVKFARRELAAGDPLKSGDLVEVELSVESKNDYEYILIADPKPAGFEPVEVRSGWIYQGLPAYKEFRDDKVAFFAERLPKGRFNLSYRVKAEIPGLFSALPARTEAMYAPELRGNAAEWKARIED